MITPFCLSPVHTKNLKKGIHSPPPNTHMPHYVFFSLYFTIILIQFLSISKQKNLTHWKNWVLQLWIWSLETEAAASL